MQKFRTITSMLLLCGGLVLGGCSNEPASAPAPTEKQVINVDLTATVVKEKLKLGMSKEEVKNLLEVDYDAEVTSSKNDTKMWRYDFGKKEGYTFTAPDNMDEVDIQGLEDGSLKSQLFVEFDKEEKVLSFAFYSKNEKGELVESRLMQDGTVKESTIKK
ncbi:MAG TPA: hypothetical protein VEZ13_18535 [Brevibacillus sp.]|nr:hypothetical protein [Brevibacillus sp.]